MSHKMDTERFKIRYVESKIDTPVLWESHCHAQFEMIGVTEGDVSIMIEGKQYRLTENQATVIPPLCYHTITANKRGSYRRVTVLFDPSAVPAPLQDYFAESTDIAVFYPTHLANLRSICRRPDAGFYHPFAESLMVQSFYEYIEARQKSTETETDAFLQRSIAYIESHLSEKILLDDLAKFTSRSKSSFCHLFEEKMKISPKQYILQKKLALANRLIRDGVPATVAAMRVGYENYSNFYRVYKRQFQKSPSR